MSQSARRLDPELTGLLQARLPEVAGHTVRAVTEEVGEYADAFDSALGDTIETAVQMALGGFLRMAARGQARDPGTPGSPTIDGAYALGRGEARNGRSADALLSAYRVGARVAWREMSRTAVESGAGADELATFAEMVFAYIDELSAASVAGHADELETTGRVLAQRRDDLAQALLRGDSVDRLTELAEHADWKPPKTLTAVVLAESHVRRALGTVDARSLHPSVAPGLPKRRAVLLLANAAGRNRTRLARALENRDAVLGPARPWADVRASYTRALRGLALDEPGVIDTEERLADLVLRADPEARADLRERMLGPLADLKPTARAKLEETLRAWLLHLGRREDVAAALFVHPQTVRYRMGQLRELYGDRLDDPDEVRALVLALG